MHVGDYGGNAHEIGGTVRCLMQGQSASGKVKVKVVVHFEPTRS